MKRLFALAFLMVCGLPAFAYDLPWRTFDSLPEGDRALAEPLLYDMFGDKPEFWPDWIDPAALYVPAGRDFMLIIRRPLHAACGQYGFTIFTPLTSDGHRAQIGDFCAGSLTVLPVSGRDWPDIQIAEGKIQNAAGEWQRLDQRLRWKDGQWWRILTP